MTLGFSQITNDAKATTEFINKYGKYFDKYFITVAAPTKMEFGKLKKLTDPKLVLSYFKWCDDFAAARNHNLKTIDTDYWFWCDTDDDIINPEKLSALVTVAAANSVDVFQMKYDYAQNVNGDAISDHWRERLMSRKYEGTWDAPVHETFQGPPAIWEQTDWVSVRHNKTQAEVDNSAARNTRILHAHWEKTKDPRDAFYLGMMLLGARHPKEAIPWFHSHTQTSGADEDKYRSWCKLAECEWMLGNHEEGLYATDEAVKLRPQWPDAYFIKVIILGSQEKFLDAIEWMKVAAAKPKPETLHAIDPTLYEYRGLANGAQCYLFSGQVKEAYKIYSYVKEKNPTFWEEMSSEDEVNWDKVFEEAYFDQRAIDSLKWLLHYTRGEGGRPEKLFESLPPRIFNDVRLNGERANFLPKKRWPYKSLVFYCGRGDVAWGPDSLKTDGIGGSEEAVIYLSRELSKLGWQVTVYCEREEEYTDDFGINAVSASTGEVAKGRHQVAYKPWTLFNPNDEFDVFVAWRLSGIAHGIKARIKAVDLHDTPIGHATITNKSIENIDKFFFKSNYQTTYAKNVPKEKIVVVGNGIEPRHFK